MPEKEIPLDKIITQGTVYKTASREVLIIEEIGTNSTTIGNMSIDRKVTTYLRDLVGPMHTTTSNLLGPLDLKDLFLVVPPETEFEWQGGSGTKARLLGRKQILAPGEKISGELDARFKAQVNSYKTTLEATYSHGTDVAWPAGLEKEVLSLTPKTIEAYKFDDIIEVSIANVSGGVAEGDWSITFYLDNNPIENIFGTNVKEGIDVLSMPRPPAGTTELEAFTLERFPITVFGDHTLSIRCKNQSGASKSPTTGTSITVTVTAVARYAKT